MNKKKSKKSKRNIKGGGSINVHSQVPLEQQWNSPSQQAPQAPPNGGLYTGAAFNGPWLAIPTTPTTDNMINLNLNSANPPPRANTQYPLTVNPGNNYQAMKGVNWFTKTGPLNPGPFKLQVASGGGKNKRKKTKSIKKSIKTKGIKTKGIKTKRIKTKGINKGKKTHMGGNKDYSINVQSVVPINSQWNSPSQMAPKPPYNGGLYTGAAFNGPWGNIPVTPTAGSMMKNISSATPPPGAMKQYPSLVRPGNNYAGMDINWYNPTNGPFKMQVVSKGGSKKKSMKKSMKNKK